ncbi:MAG: DEAD/DEAH box helicase family protein [Candidatus Poribacteria bacterium]|nr:DEAD/DEAH box helicase family protein [Candidatus Poribacteria bacterium]
MQHLFEKLQDDTLNWRKEGYPCQDYPLIGEVLRHQFEGEANDRVHLKYLREPQFQSLELYWFLRLVLQTSHIVDLYKHYYDTGDIRDFCEAFGIPLTPNDLIYITNVDTVINLVENNPEFVKLKGIDPVYEAVTLPYASYIFALAMGTGKTVLIGTIIATEFAMALRYPDGEFMKNALVFAPGTTIIESLREISDLPFDQILPASLHRDFLANLKITYPQTGAKEIQVQTGSTYNVIVTNTEKIALRANVKKRNNQTEFEFEEKKEQAELEANLRLQKITSLPSLGVFSDEAHHTYGNKIDAELKRVRETVNYIHEKTPLVAVINTTGTPYAKRQMLREVVAWYSLGEGIKDNILKSLHNGIVQYPIGTIPDQDVIRSVIDDFFDHYGDVSLPDGAKAKIAFYFKTQEHLDTSHQHIQNALTGRGESTTQVLVNTQKSSPQEIDEFNQLNNPDSQKRIILLIGKGTEGWNCPSLFACALIKEQTTSSNFILQASTRCLRQVKGNTHTAKIFLDTKNSTILDKELQANFGTTLGELRKQDAETEEFALRIRKPDLPKLKIMQLVRKVVPLENAPKEIQLHKPTDVGETAPTFRSILTPDFTQRGASPLTALGTQDEVEITHRTTDCYTLARRLATNYHLSVIDTLKNLKKLYPEGQVPYEHLDSLCKQVEDQQQNYEVIEEQIAEHLALIRIHDADGNLLFEKDEAEDCYVHKVRLRKSKADLLFSEKDLDDNHDVSFHYMPYDFDSEPEQHFFKTILATLNQSVADVKVFLFTGSLTNTRKTDFHFEYKGTDNNYHRYFPDFVIVKNTGEFYIVEIKSENERRDPDVIAKKKAVKRLAKLQPDAHFEYKVIYTKDAFLQENLDEMQKIREWIYGDDETSTFT